MTDDDIFNRCADIFDINDESTQRDMTIKLLSEINQEQYTPIINHLIRQTGLYPYMKYETSEWFDKILINNFMVDIGEKEPVVLHLKQSEILKQLLENKSLILSAPTSFGKSFIIDALIQLKKPKNVLIIVPTISLMDETRRRLRKFNDKYNIITTSNIQPKEKNIFILTQERAIGYIDDIYNLGLDIFIVDEFYKILSDDIRSLSLKVVVSKFSNIAKQKYYLCPNINKIELPFGTKNMKHIKINFNTVYLETKRIQCNQKTKNLNTLKIIKENTNKQNLIYVNKQSVVNKLVLFLSNEIADKKSQILQNYKEWLNKHYSKSWSLSNAIQKGICVHYGKIHRPISQMNIKLFNDKETSIIVCTTSLIEGVNTSAENLLLYSNRIKNDEIDSFTYKNIIGRSGRMFKYFIGNVYLLEEAPEDESKNLEIEKLDIDDILRLDDYLEISNDILEKVDSKKEKINSYVKDIGKTNKILKLIKSGKITSKIDDIVDILEKITATSFNPNSFQYSNDNNIDKWGFFKKLIKGKQISFEHVKIMSNFYNKTIPELMEELNIADISIFFDLENKITYELSTYFSDINELQKVIFENNSYDISNCIYKLTNLFMPANILQLEEYGLPRVISKKINNIKLLPIDNDNIKITELINQFKDIGKENLINELNENNLLEPFDINFIEYFYDGI
ncbi:DEAD/DEAH box helicase [Campylobacter mucosalis]|uniref:DEAD/DEAH box helicase n=1 Tax=Campylobacter mucosalis TaxID=202 RepID=UPI0014704981|nr:DEAD/DEAH box helicase [Campylobacter mucosalis]